MLAKAAGVSLRSVQRILEAYQLAPHRIRVFKLSTEADSRSISRIARVLEIVGGFAGGKAPNERADPTAKARNCPRTHHLQPAEGHFDRKRSSDRMAVAA
jgi:hypothetical protein